MLPLNLLDNKTFAESFAKKHLTVLIRARDNALNYGIESVVKGKKKKIYIPKEDKKHWRKKLSDKNLKQIMTLTPSQQRKLFRFFKNSKLSSVNNKNSNNYQILKYIFTTCGYNTLDTKDKRLFYTNLEINTCIYCNRNYVFDVQENGHIKGHIDHFYPKGKYPYLAMSYFNFIPVCESCNKVKGEYDTIDEGKTIIHPYERNEEKIIGVSFKEIDNLSYVFKKDDLLDKLHIEKIYNEGHKDILQELYVKFFQENTKEHFDSLSKSLKDMGFTVDEIHKFISAGYLKYEEHHKRSMSKAIKDIRKEFEVFYQNNSI